MKVVYENLVDLGTVTGQTAATGYPATNVQIIQPSIFYRTANEDNAWLDLALAGAYKFDTVAVVGCSSTAHANLLRRNRELNTSPWTKTNVTVSEDNTTDICTEDDGGSSYSYINEGTANGNHYVAQTWTAPGNGDLQHVGVTLSAYVAGTSGAAVTRVRLEVEDASARLMRCDYNIGAGSVGSVATSGTPAWTSTSATIADAADEGTSDYYKITLSGIPGSATHGNLTVRIYTLASGGAVSYTGTNRGLNVSGLMLNLGASRGFLAETTTESGALIRGGESSGQISGMEWMHFSTRDLSWRDSNLWWATIDTAIAGNSPEVWISDPDNLASQVDVGRWIVGRALSLPGHLTNLSIDVEEQGGDVRTRGGQLYRGEHPRTRSMDFSLEYLTRAEALGSMLELYRRLGRSTPGLFIADETETTYADEVAIYGYLEQPHPVPRQIGTYWQTRFTVLEAI